MGISAVFAWFAVLRRQFADMKAGKSKYRLVALAAAAILGIFALILGISLLGAVLGIRALNPSFGLFFYHAYGILALFIPVYLGYAALILADPYWRPDRLFILIAALFPFLTLTLGFICIRDFDALSLDYVFLELTGKTGFGLIIVVLALLEVAAIQMLRNALFPYVNEDGKKRRIWRGGRTEKLFLPPPPNANTTGIKSENFGEWIHSGAHASSDDSGDGGLEQFNLNLPAMRPLNSPLALEYLSGGLEEQEEHRIESEKIAIDSVERALEEAELLAALHSEQARKKTASHTAHHSRKKYHVPVEILNQYPDGEYWVIDQATRDAAVTLRETLEEFKIQAEVTGIRKGPVITMFEILPAPGVKLSRIVNLQDNIALRLAASSVRIVAPIPGKHAVGIEVPNARRNIVSFREIIESELQREGKRPEIPVVMGKDISGEAQTIDLTQTPHLLIAGATGAGKSVCVNSIILSILYQLSPADCRLILIDPKIVELKLYNDIPHLMTPVITEPKKAFQALQYCIYEMERRYACLDSMGVRDIRNYNKRIRERNIAQEYMPYMVIIIDEFADLMATTGKELESTVARLCAMSRAVGIHLVLATQRPSIDVITGLIKANIPSRIAFMVASKMDSRIIIDTVGAEKLLGKGDMLYAGVVDPFPIRMQGAFVSEEEVETVVEHVKTLGEPDYIDDEIFYDDEEETVDASLFSDGDDPLYEKALEIVLQQGKASASYIQRRLKIGYNRAARLVEEMEHKGVVGPAQGSKPRELLRGV
ncbi:MAG: DNA translocase FtsK [Treponema sp.]|nr:DNA translocase FtsK [Treponema sp.]